MARSLYRSVTYGLDASLALARIVARSGGRTDADSLASDLSYSGVRNGAFLSRLANARLFGLVTGRSGQVVLTDLGRRCLSEDPGVRSPALADACWAVPLFHRVLEDASGQELGDVDALARVLETRFGEAPARCRTTARVLLESAGRAGLLPGGRVDLSLVTGRITNFTDSDSAPRRAFAPSVRWPLNPHSRRSTRHTRPRADEGGAGMDDGTSARNSGPPTDEGGLWIDEGTASPGRHANRRRVGTVLGVAACVALIGVPVGLLAASGSGPTTRSAQQHHVTVSGTAKRSVLAALSATTDSGNFAFTYQLSDTPSANGSAPGQSTEVQGSGTINTNPMAMAASAYITSGGASGLQVGVRVDPMSVWEVSATDNGLTPLESNAGGGTSLPGFAGLVEGTLGQREGAVAMMGMASPTGYLDLEQPAVTNATEVGTATVDGVAVTQYELTIDPSSLASAPGTSSEEQSAINAAIQILNSHDYRTIRDVVSIDASDFIRESASTVTFGDSGTVTLDAHFSNFGCAGTVLMPGQSGISAPPSGCASADTGTASTTTTTSTTSTSSTSSTAPTTDPTVPSQTTSTTIAPATPMPAVTTTTAPNAATTTTSIANDPSPTTG